jgi:hypothetical protein
MSTPASLSTFRAWQRAALAVATAAAAPAVLAHQGHGLSGVSHWHATDAVGLALALAAAALVAWWLRRK